jgi:hypothetical protein
MSKTRDDRKRNMRREFALTRTDGTPVGSYWLTEADGCRFGYLEGGWQFAGDMSADHEPGSHVLTAQ